MHRKTKPERRKALFLPETPVLRCLCVRPPYAGRIVSGEKKEEYRTQPTRIRGIIGIIESGSGTVIGEVELYDCTELNDWSYIWHLRNARRYPVPVPYLHPVGAVVWVRVPKNKDMR